MEQKKTPKGGATIAADADIPRLLLIIFRRFLPLSLILPLILLVPVFLHLLLLLHGTGGGSQLELELGHLRAREGNARRARPEDRPDKDRGAARASIRSWSSSPTAPLDDPRPTSAGRGGSVEADRR